MAGLQVEKRGQMRHNSLPDEIFLEAEEDQKTDFSYLLSDCCDLVGHYSRRSLTVQTDRLVAVSGLAEKYAGVLRDRYLAGFMGVYADGRPLLEHK